MPDQLEGIVQRMIDANESEENIASVIKEYRPPQPAGHGTAAMLGAPSEPYAEDVNPADRWQNKAAAGLESLAHPKTAGDFAGLLIPSGMGEAIGAIKGAVKGYISAGSRAIEGAPSLKSIPGRMLKTLYQDATKPAPIRGFARYAPNVSADAHNVFAEGAATEAPIVDRYMANSGSTPPTAAPGGHIVGHVPERVPSAGTPLQTERVPYGVPNSGPAVLSDVEKLKAAGLPQWQITALQSDPAALARALAGLK